MLPPHSSIIINHEQHRSIDRWLDQFLDLDAYPRDAPCAVLRHDGGHHRFDYTLERLSDDYASEMREAFRTARDGRVARVVFLLDTPMDPRPDAASFKRACVLRRCTDALCYNRLRCDADMHTSWRVTNRALLGVANSMFSRAARALSDASRTRIRRSWVLDHLYVGISALRQLAWFSERVHDLSEAMKHENADAWVAWLMVQSTSCCDADHVPLPRVRRPWWWMTLGHALVALFSVDVDAQVTASLVMRAVVCPASVYK